ncbi:hypothetical protein [Microseira sp. BLCC-F43]
MSRGAQEQQSSKAEENVLSNSPPAEEAHLLCCPPAEEAHLRHMQVN